MADRDMEQNNSSLLTDVWEFGPNYLETLDISREFEVFQTQRRLLVYHQ